MKNIADIKHPEYTRRISDWKKFAAVMESGHKFVEEYLERFSKREDDTDFTQRKKISYCPALAKAAILDIKNSIFQRMPDIERLNITPDYDKAIKGIRNGVDGQGHSITEFIGQEVLPELLSMARVGVFVDKESFDSTPTRKDTNGKAPYFYVYGALEILSWKYDDNNQLISLLLESNSYKEDDDYNLPSEIDKEYKYYQLTDEGVSLDIYDSNSVFIENKVIKLNRIPFVMFELTHSLLQDAADYQIALTNLASSDLNYCMVANFPMYTEQYDFATELARKSIDDDDKDNEATRGISQGRRYPKGMDRPDFIAPPADPIKASMDKQDVLKAEIRQLVNLAVSTLQPKRASAESKQEDNKGLEAGLSYIGLELQFGERQLADIWASYQGEVSPQSDINYPCNYQIISDGDRLVLAKKQHELLSKIPSLNYQKAIAKDIVKILLERKITDQKLLDIYKEIDTAVIIDIDPEVIQGDHDVGLISTKTASKARLYPEGEAEMAKQDKADRAAAIAIAQSKVTTVNNGARGVDDLSSNPREDAKNEKEEARIK